MKEPILLAIETSCDDTSVAISQGKIILANVTYNQAIHIKYGGVVPELASRNHEKNIVAVVTEALNISHRTLADIDAIAVTKGPGLIGSLLVGVQFAKALAISLNIPCIGVNHMQAHILAHFIEDDKTITTESTFFKEKIEFPLLCLTVSGGHTQLVLMKDYFDFEIVGETLDDAAGEAFDKTAKLLGLPYPGGPHIDTLAASGEVVHKFPKAQVPDYNYSFSGIKTSVLYFLQAETKANENFIAENLNNIAASIQHTIIEMLLDKLTKAALHYKVENIALAGGVSANKGLRKALNDVATKHEWKTSIPPLPYCTDNAAMVAITGYLKFINNNISAQTLVPLARLKLTD